MNNDYRRLQTIFNNLNEAIIIFHSDISELVPEFHAEVLDGLHLTLETTNNIFKLASEQVLQKLYKNS